MSFLLTSCKELDFGELLAVNGGCAGGGGSCYGGGAKGSTSGSGSRKSSSGGSCSGGYVAPKSPTCGGGGTTVTTKPTCSGSGTTVTTKPTCSGSGGNLTCAGGKTPTCTGSVIPTNPTCTGRQNLPNKQIWTGDGPHCDIFAWDIAIDMGLDPRNGKETVYDLNDMNVNQFFNEYCKNDSKGLSEKGCAGQSGFIFFDWGGDDPSKRDGVFDHVEFCQVSEDGSSYVCYQTDGYSTPVPTTYNTAVDKNGKGGAGTKAVFVPLN